MSASERLGRILIGVLLITAICMFWNSNWPSRESDSVCSPGVATTASEEEPFLLPPPPSDRVTLASTLFSYIELPQRWCRRLAMFGGHFYTAKKGQRGLDGNKFFCLDAAPRESCLVYSFGSKDEWSFETEVIKNLGCEVHTFDPSLSGNKAPKNTHGAKFYPLGLGGRSEVTSSGWKMGTLRDIRQQLGHMDRKVTYLKVDIEGSEWSWLEAEAESLQYVDQIGMEVHFPSLTAKSFQRVYNVFRRLQAAGFRTIFSEANRVWGRNRKVRGLSENVGEYYEIVWIRI